jgi:hypothetical protein
MITVAKYIFYYKRIQVPDFNSNCLIICVARFENNYNEPFSFCFISYFIIFSAYIFTEQCADEQITLQQYQNIVSYLNLGSSYRSGRRTCGINITFEVAAIDGRSRSDKNSSLQNKGGTATSTNILDTIYSFADPRF